MRELDLNLLRTFIAIFEAGSLKEAANRLFMTQPSVSYSLARLREQLGDPLFIRGPKGVVPTRRARELIGPFKQAVLEVDAVVSGGRRFDPSTSQRKFRLCLSDLGELAFLPAIMSRISLTAPNVEIEVVPMQIDSVSRWLAQGDVDAAVASVGIPSTARHPLIVDERYVCILPEGQSASVERLTLGEFMTARHIEIDQSAGHYQADQVLEGLGLERKIGLHVHHFAVLPRLVMNCGMIAMVPYQVARMFAETWPISIRELPFDLPVFDVSLYSHGPAAQSEPLQWFLDEIVAALTRD
jgi:DNA-binding transcriptional LysR family regulator